MFRLTNEERTKQNALEAEDPNNTLAPRKMIGSFALVRQVSRMKAYDQEIMKHYLHESPTYNLGNVMFKTFGIPFFRFGENFVRRNNALASMIAWMNSPTHKKNILKDYAFIGCGFSGTENV